MSSIEHEPSEMAARPSSSLLESEMTPATVEENAKSFVRMLKKFRPEERSAAIQLIMSVYEDEIPKPPTPPTPPPVVRELTTEEVKQLHLNISEEDFKVLMEKRLLDMLAEIEVSVKEWNEMIPELCIWLSWFTRRGPKKRRDIVTMATEAHYVEPVSKEPAKKEFPKELLERFQNLPESGKAFQLELLKLTHPDYRFPEISDEKVFFPAGKLMIPVRNSNQHQYPLGCPVLSTGVASDRYTSWFDRKGNYLNQKDCRAASFAECVAWASKVTYCGK